MIYYRDKKTNIISALKKYEGEKLINKESEGLGHIIIYWVGGKRKLPNQHGKGKAKMRVTYMGEWEFFQPMPFNIAKKLHCAEIDDNTLSDRIIEMREDIFNMFKEQYESETHISDEEFYKDIKENLKFYTLNFYNFLKRYLIPQTKYDPSSIRNESTLTKRHITIAIKKQDEQDKRFREYVEEFEKRELI